MNSYVPRGKVKILLDAMEAAGTERRWSTAECAAVMDIPHGNISSHVKAAIGHGMLVAERDGARTTYSLPQEPPPVDFNAALWADGDLVLQGVDVAEDGSILVRAEHVGKIKQLLTGSVVP